MPIGPSSGSTFAIGGNSNVATNQLTDTYINVAHITNLGEFGPQFAVIKFDDLGSGLTTKFKGQRDDGKLSLDLGRASEDAGQAALILANLDRVNDYNMRVTNNDAPGTTAVVLATSALTAAASAVLHFSSTTGVVVGMNIADTTAPTVIPVGTTVKSIVTNTSVTMTQAATGAGVGSADSITFSGGPTTSYLKGKVMTHTNNTAGPTSVTRSKVDIEVTSGSIIEIPAT
ncbi:MAG: hypothetical protein JWP25_8953 [Bradyrhizobium sp.]|nr:hypothetical protein [Bradyrhizobium sp.]